MINKPTDKFDNDVQILGKGIRWQKGKYTEEEKREKHEKGAKESILLQKETVRQIFEKERMEKIMSKVEDKMQMQVQGVPSHWLGTIRFTKDIVDLINEYIDETDPQQSSYSHRLIGQLKNNEKSSQRSFDLESSQGREIKTILDSIGSAYLQQAYKRKSVAEVVSIWTNHAYAGDYNPLHDHNAATQGGLSGFLWLKTPDCLKVNLNHGNNYMNDASGISDGCTQLVWGLRARTDIDALHCATEQYFLPEEGTMLIFPNWMKHQVLPFYGEGERRSIAMNWAIIDSQSQLFENMTPAEITSYHEAIQAQKDKRLEDGTLDSTPYQLIVAGHMRYVRTDIFPSGNLAKELSSSVGKK